MLPIKKGLLNTSSLTAVSSNHTKKPLTKPIVRERRKKEPSQGRTPKVPGSSAFRIGRYVKVPDLDPSQISTMNDSSIATVTRHMKSSDLGRTMAGSFKFGTTANYRPKDEKDIGRFSDFQEGTQQHAFSARDGLFTSKIEGIEFHGVMFEGFEKDIVVEYFVNDFCSCSSLVSSPT